MSITLHTFKYYGLIAGKNSVWISNKHKAFTRFWHRTFWKPIEDIITWSRRRKLPLITDNRQSHFKNSIDNYWGNHTVWMGPFLSKQASIDYIFDLIKNRPFKRELTNLYGPHAGKIIMDYGCGPGNDLAGFAEFSDAREIIGVDISRVALEMARSRVSWHAKDNQKFHFVQVSDKNIVLPFDDQSIDYIQSLGVLMCATDVVKILRELKRMLKRGGEMRIMLYNADSVRVQLTVGYEWRIRNGQYPELTPEELYERTADLGAPRMRVVRPSDVQEWCSQVDMTSEFLGGYFMPGEINDAHRLLSHAQECDHLTKNQQAFLCDLTFADEGIPYFRGLPAGLGAVYRLTHK